MKKSAKKSPLRKRRPVAKKSAKAKRATKTKSARKMKKSYLSKPRHRWSTPTRKNNKIGSVVKCKRCGIRELTRSRKATGPNKWGDEAVEYVYRRNNNEKWSTEMPTCSGPPPKRVRVSRPPAGKAKTSKPAKKSPKVVKSRKRPPSKPRLKEQVTSANREAEQAA